MGFQSWAKKEQQEKKAKAAEKEAQKCPRCESTKTKFCYYNNYSLSQPRYFCKSCKRYWTKGGSLRNIPIGGGCRKKNHPRPKRPHLDQPANANANAIPTPIINNILPPFAYHQGFPNSFQTGYLDNLHCDGMGLCGEITTTTSTAVTTVKQETCSSNNVGIGKEGGKQQQQQQRGEVAEYYWWG